MNYYHHFSQVGQIGSTGIPLATGFDRHEYACCHCDSQQADIYLRVKVFITPSLNGATTGNRSSPYTDDEKDFANVPYTWESDSP